MVEWSSILIINGYIYLFYWDNLWSIFTKCTFIFITLLVKNHRATFIYSFLLILNNFKFFLDNFFDFFIVTATKFTPFSHSLFEFSIYPSFLHPIHDFINTFNLHRLTTCPFLFVNNRLKSALICLFFKPVIFLLNHLVLLHSCLDI